MDLATRLPRLAVLAILLAATCAGSLLALAADPKDPAPMAPAPRPDATTTDRPARPALDLALPKTVETATFALG